MSEALAQEVAGFGIKVTLVEPGAYATDWDGPSAAAASPLAAYDDVRAALHAAFEGGQGDRKAVGPALLSVVDSDNPPLRVFFGTAPLQIRSSPTSMPSGSRPGTSGRTSPGRPRIP